VVCTRGSTAVNFDKVNDKERRQSEGRPARTKNSFDKAAESGNFHAAPVVLEGEPRQLTLGLKTSNIKSTLW
jgi:hypothetical protein